MISANVLVSVVQEIRAKRTLDRIALLTRPTAQVIRDGNPCNLPPEELVVGDVLQVGPGDQIVLDGRIIGDGQMQVDESQLTGESNLVAKQAGAAVYSGSFCVNGGARYVVEKVSEQSLSNQITAGARAFRRVLTPLQNEIYLVVRIMLAMVIYIEFLLVLDALIARANPGETVASATLVVGLVPNGLFLSITLAYALRDNRAFCKYVCPVSVPLKVTSRFSVIKIGQGTGQCNDCNACEKMCPMDVRISDYILNNQRVLSTECSLCQTCITVCAQNALKLSFGFDMSKQDLLRERAPKVTAEAVAAD